MAKVLLATDYRDQLYFSTARYSRGVDVDALRRYLIARGHAVTVTPLAQVNLVGDLKGTWIVYQSSEDRNLLYKDYIEDVILGLLGLGARLIPEFQYFRAHDNKVFFEILRGQSALPELSDLGARIFGTLEDLLRSDYREWKYPKVIKSASGFGSRGVRLAKGPRELRRLARRMSRSWRLGDVATVGAKRVLYPDYIAESLHRRKFIVQDFVPELTHDFKVVALGKAYYVLQRSVRNKDFRASGSGKFLVPRDPPLRVLDAAQRAMDYFGVPFVSLDLAESGDRVLVLEAQFVRFGSIAVENAPWYFEKRATGWQRVDAAPDYESTLAAALDLFIQTNRSSEPSAEEIRQFRAKTRVELAAGQPSQV